MAFPVAVQSAVFYFMACTPCMSARNRYRTKKQFDKERKERAALEIDEPQLYRHPSPFNMNPYWEEEMRMGPSLPKKGRSGRQQRQQREKQQREQQMQNSSQRNLTSAGQDSILSSQGGELGRSRGDSGSSGPLGGVLADTITDAPPSTDGPARSGNITSTSLDRKAIGTCNAGSSVTAPAKVSQAPPTIAAPKPAVSPTLVPEDDTHSIIHSMPNTSMSVLEATPSMTVGSDTLSENWNHKRYQREDEELWGADTASRTHKLMDAIAKASSSAGRLIESARLGTKELRMSSPPPVPSANTITDQDRANFYSPTFIHPPVNEYHPPVVSSKPAHKDGLRWMLQPPPPAKVMEGKVPVSRSTSVASSYAGRKSGSELSLTRRMALEARMRRVDSSNSGATVKRPHTTSSVQRLNSNSLSGARSRSDSLASSVEEPMHVPVPGAMASSWSDEDGMLRPTYRVPSNSAQAPHDNGVSHSANNSANSHHHNINSNNSASVKLETILSSNTSTKENTVPEASKAVSAVATAETKTVLDLSAPAPTSSQDSGLGLTA
ncbi:hypothetical protein F503_08591 [Ophiostoma piceae UAMH 11346]|uniref:Signal peptide-containing protein n=1 Tax=Ophiostoma piceae (strain UAMH 11346) TaxID=1262450 RepID=S3BM38_OPHP1|nr:hypothetical protein F503_08591 [Ophiostoma piceae UAMH 11346]